MGAMVFLLCGLVSATKAADYYLSFNPSNDTVAGAIDGLPGVLQPPYSSYGPWMRFVIPNVPLRPVVYQDSEWAFSDPLNTGREVAIHLFVLDNSKDVDVYTNLTSAEVNSLSADAIPLPLPSDGLIWSYLDASGNRDNIYFAVVPEPSTFIILAFPLLLFGIGGVRRALSRLGSRAPKVQPRLGGAAVAPAAS
jgi:hypothetical protein